MGEVLGELRHGVEHEVGTCVDEHLLVEGAGVDADGVDAGGVACLYAQGSILDDDGLFGHEIAGFLQSHQVGIGMGLAVSDGAVFARDNAVPTEDAGIGDVELLNERGLAAAGDENALEAMFAYDTQHVGCTRHGFGGAHLDEGLALLAIDMLYLPLSGVTTALLHEEIVDYLLARGTLDHIKESTVTSEPIVLAHDLIPCFGMMWHGVEENSIHVEEESLFRECRRHSLVILS